MHQNQLNISFSLILVWLCLSFDLFSYKIYLPPLKNLIISSKHFEGQCILNCDGLYMVDTLENHRKGYSFDLLFPLGGKSCLSLPRWGIQVQKLAISLVQLHCVSCLVTIPCRSCYFWRHKWCFKFRRKVISRQTGQ